MLIILVMTHFSWQDINKNYFEQLEKLDQFQFKIQHGKYINLQNNIVPTCQYHKLKDSLHQPELHKEIYNSFHNMAGCLIIKNVFSSELMEQYNQWCENWLKTNEHDPNGTHPKQKNKYLINDIIGRLSKDEPSLFMKLHNNEVLIKILDVLLGFTKYGSSTCHWIQPNGDRQLSHVDYPIHIGSGKYWDSSVSKCQETMTRHQINTIMKHFSCQVLIASDAMNQLNGSTEVVPASHLLDDLDINIHDKMFYDMMEPRFMNVELEQGDVLIFNRALCHRGGKNLSNERRNALIFQCIYSFGIGQEIINYEDMEQNISECEEFNKLNKKTQQKFLERFKFEYPRHVTQSA